MHASQAKRSIVAADLIQTRRDLVDELTRRGSPIRRILDDLEVDTEQRAALESGLHDLSNEILTSSQALASLKQALQVLSETVDGIGSPQLQPLPARLEDLARSVSIDLEVGGLSLPIRFHGSGARSLASLQVQGVLYDRRLGLDGPALRPHPVSLIEEPEAHLHPQAQFELPTLLGRIKGQVIASTHSTHLVSVAEPRSIRVLQRDGGNLTIIDLRPAEDDSPAERARRPSLHIQEMEKIRRLVERPFGELLYSTAVILGDGATERALLPPAIRHVFGSRAHGLCVVDPGSMNSEHAIAVVKFCNLMNLPWILFSDSDEQGKVASTNLVKQYANGDTSRIIWVPEEAQPGEKGAATEKMFIDFDSDLCRAACEPLGLAEEDDDVLEFMKAHKGATGRLLADELVERYPWRSDSAPPSGNWPSALNKLVEKLNQVLPRESQQ